MWTNENRARYDRSKLRYPSDLTDAESRRRPPSCQVDAAPPLAPGRSRLPRSRGFALPSRGRLERRPARLIRNERSEAMTMLDATGMCASRTPDAGRPASHPATPI